MYKVLTMAAAAALLAGPALAQQAPQQTPPVNTPAPGTTGTAPGTMPSDATAPTPSQTTPAQPTQTPAANSADQVSQTIESQWASYDANADGKLSKKEFAAWMGSLRANDPSAKGGAAEMKKWNDAAFTQTDTDKNGAVSKEELKGFLAQPAK